VSAGLPPIAQDARAWADRVRAATRTEPVVLQPGDWLDLGHEPQCAVAGRADDELQMSDG
jgi:hypothetical protein